MAKRSEVARGLGLSGQCRARIVVAVAIHLHMEEARAENTQEMADSVVGKQWLGLPVWWEGLSAVAKSPTSACLSCGSVITMVVIISPLP